MSFQWDEYMALARSFAETDDECHRRCAISRAYYAAYHAGRRRWAADQGVPTTRQFGHGELWDYFRLRPHERKIAEKGRRLLELRRTADYDISPACSLKNTQHALNLADELLGALAST